MQCVLRGDAALMYHMLRLLHEMKPLLWLTTGFCSDCRMDLCAAVVQCDACCALVDCMLGDRATLRACGKKKRSLLQCRRCSWHQLGVLCGIGKVAGKQCILPQAPYYQL
jgi:hypothetical protein